MAEQTVTIICPHCAYSRSIPRGNIPSGRMRVTCPKCRETFAFSTVSAPGNGLSGQSDGESLGQDDPLEAAPGNASSVPPPTGPRTLAFSFQGNARDYFGIWIVNTLLKIVTCGIYSAWAKVRQRSYFYGSTTLQGEPFSYLADPLTIFKGWLIGAAAFVVYAVAQQISIVLSIITAVAIFGAVPWLVVRSRIFNARNSSHRNIRFAFASNYREAYVVYLGLPFLGVLTLGLLTPYVMYRQKKFLIENSLYGATPFAFGATPKQFYRPYVVASLAALALFAASFGLSFLLLGGSVDLLKTRNAGAAFLALVPVIVVFPLLYFYLGTYLRTSLANLAWNSTTIGKSRFISTLLTRDMAWLYLTNAVAIACTLGIMIPWAAVRVARYRFQQLKVETREGLDGFIALARKQEINATGEEIGDIFGVNVDLGF